MSEILDLKQLQECETCCKNPMEEHECICKLYKVTGGVPAICVEVVAKTALIFLEMLKRHMWQKRSSDGREFCIECRNLKENGHTKDCRLAEILKVE